MLSRPQILFSEGTWQSTTRAQHCDLTERESCPAADKELCLLALISSRDIVASLPLRASLPFASRLLLRPSFLRAAMPENSATGILTPMNANPASTSSPSKKAKLSTAAVTPAPISTLRVKRLAPDATLPQRGSAKAAGYDLASAQDTCVPARGKAVVKTGLSIAIPADTYARIAPRSGLAVKHFIDTGAGVVDEDYRGEVGVVLFNHSDVDFQVKKGDRVAQLILERIMTPDIEEVDELESTVRGSGGYGSTGVAK